MLTEAFRLAIVDDVEAAKDKHFQFEKVRICPLSGDLYNKETCHADHGGPKNGNILQKSLSFSKLVQNFLKEEKRVLN